MSNEIFHVLIAHLDTSLMKMLIFRLCLLLLTGKAESAECLLKYGVGLNEYVDPKLAPVLAETQPSGTFNLGSCKTSCDKMVKELLYIQNLNMINFRHNVPTLYLRLVPVHVTNMQC